MNARFVRPQVECLESRLTPDATSFVTGLYRDVLRRPGTTAEISAFVDQLNNGLTADQLALGFVNSRERHALEVTNAYQEVLQRAPDAAGLATFANLLDQGQSSALLRLHLIGSAEFQQAQVDDTSFIGSLYSNLLFRNPDAIGEANFLTALSSGVSREAVALAFVSSVERASNAVDQLYVDFLGRDLSPTERNAFLPLLQQNGGAADQLESIFVTSAEYRSAQGF